ncbi:hypothetical protein PR002_g27190, partial [Phytophthora rubi]
MLECFRNAIDEGFGIILTNPNNNAISYAGRQAAAADPGSSSSEERVDSLWGS